jgi:myosin-3
VHTPTLSPRRYKDEGLDLTAIGFSDNGLVISLFTARPVGILSMLDEESRFPKATERTLLDKLEANMKKSEIFSVATGKGIFSVTHFAGVVKYTADDLLVSNRDPLPEATVTLLATSVSLLISELFTEKFLEADFKPKTPVRTQSRFASMFGSRRKASAKRAPSTKRVKESIRHKDNAKSANVGGAKKGKRGGQQPATVASSFVLSLDALIALMDKSRPHFVRCIKPNADKKANAYDQDYVRRQLKYCGVLETVRIRREGYPHRIEYVYFFPRDGHRGCTMYHSPPPSRRPNSYLVCLHAGTSNSSSCTAVLHSRTLTTCNVTPSQRTGGTI